MGANGRVIAYAGSIGRLHYGEQGEKGFLIWDVNAHSVSFDSSPPRPSATVDITFEGMPKLDELQEFARANDVSGAFVRVRWTMPEEDRHEVDRSAIQGIFGAAAEVKLEGRVIPVVRTRAAGISQEATIAAKIAVWARLTEARGRAASWPVWKPCTRARRRRSRRTSWKARSRRRARFRRPRSPIQAPRRG